MVPEFPVGNGRVDYCLKIKEQKTVFIEVKRPDQELERHQEQLLSYAFRDSVDLAVLTNGIVWWMYLPLHRVNWEQRRFFAIDIWQQDVVDVTQNFRDFLDRDAVADGSAVKRAYDVLNGIERQKKIVETLPQAWNLLCQEPDDRLVELLGEKVESLCGFQPDKAVLTAFLASTVIQSDIVLQRAAPTAVRRETRRRESLNVGVAPTVEETNQAIVQEGDKEGATSLHNGVVPQEPPDVPNTNTGVLTGDAWGYTHTVPVAFLLWGERRTVTSYKGVLIGVCEVVAAREAERFLRVLELVGRKPLFSANQTDLREARAIAGTNLFVETNMSAGQVVEVCRRILVLFDYPPADLIIERRQR